MSYIKTLRATSIVHNFLKDRIKKGNIAIDATMGNGHDTLFLVNQVGDIGKVYSFDIQEVSLDNTKKLLLENNILLKKNNIELIVDGHENIDKYVNEKVDAVTFNLGYLPGGNKDIITKPKTTIQSLNIVLSLLKKGGIISIVIYYGHLGGAEEKDAILQYAQHLDWNKYAVMRCDYLNYDKSPLMLIFIEKKGYKN